MALRLRRDVQKASYYVWFLGADEAKGLRGSRVINSVLPYLISRSREQEPLKVTLQVSHKGIKILQGSSKHFIPHSAITSSVQSDDIVACVLLLYNPATKCPLHIHAYRCDSETTAEALHHQLQVLINRPENQKRFEELESRLGIVPIPNVSHKSSSSTDQQVAQKKHSQRRQEASPKRFSSSLGSDTGNSTRESECSEDHNVSPMSRSPPIIKHMPMPNSDLFDSLAAELRAKLNGNGPPLLLPPRDYDNAHKSKTNLAAIELRRCRNSAIVGTQTAVGGKQQVSSRGSSGIGSDLAPSPERHDVHSSSDEEHWSNEADNSVIALKPSQIPIERKPQLSRKSAIQPPEDNYLRDLPLKPYNPPNDGRNVDNKKQDRRPIGKLGQAWNKEDEIRPIIMRPSDYDAKFNRVLMDKQHDEIGYKERSSNYPPKDEVDFCKYKDDPTTKAPYDVRDSGFHNHIEKLLQKKLSLEHKSSYKIEEPEDEFEVINGATENRKGNLTDKQKFQEYNGKKVKVYPEPDRFGRQRYVDPDDLPFPRQKTTAHHYSNHSPDRDVVRSNDRQRERQRVVDTRPREREMYSHSNERNPYNEPSSIPYIESMEKMMKSPAMRYKTFASEGKLEYQPEGERHSRASPRKSLPRNEKSTLVTEALNCEKDYSYKRKSHSRDSKDYADTNGAPKDRFKDAKDKFRAMEGSRYNSEEKEQSRNVRMTSVERINNGINYDDWSDEEETSMSRTRQKNPDRWESPRAVRESSREYRESRSRDVSDGRVDHRDYHRDGREHGVDKRDNYGPSIPVPIAEAKSLSNLNLAYRHSFADPVFVRNGGRVGLAAVNPY